MNSKRALASQPDQLFVFFRACRLFISDFFRRLYFRRVSVVFILRRLFAASLFPGVFSGVFIFRRLFRRLYFSASFFGVFISRHLFFRDLFSAS